MKQTMKIGVVLLGALTLAMWFGISSVNKKKEQLETAMEQLEKRALQRGLVFEDMVTMIDAVGAQIDEIIKREHLILDQSGEPIRGDQKEKLVSELQMIDELILRSAQDIKTLNDKVTSDELRLGVFQRQVNGLQADLKDRATQIITLKAEIAEKDQALAFLMEQTDSLGTAINTYVETIGQQEFKIDQLQTLNKELNKGYLAIGTFDELKAKGVVGKEGGFLGFLGRKMTLQEDATLSEFMTIDKREVSRLRIEAAQLSLISEHPSDSYSILPGESENFKILEITNPDTFWQISQYLVISKKT
jgi:hypothetical protein